MVIGAQLVALATVDTNGSLVFEHAVLALLINRRAWGTGEVRVDSALTQSTVRALDLVVDVSDAGSVGGNFVADIAGSTGVGAVEVNNSTAFGAVVIGNNAG